jgi:predicted cobalt transporter CbtA
MRALPLGTVVKAALVAGLLAGLTAAVFHLIATEPVIDHAIALEAQGHQAEGAAEAPFVSRNTQKGGLVLGFLLYGLTWALLFAVIYRFAQGWLPAESRLKKGVLLAFLGYWSVGLLPFLKYPANPPGVGAPETIGYRQALYLGILALSVIGAALSMGLGHYFGQWKGWPSGSLLPSLALLAMFSGVIYLVMPSNPDEIGIPTDVVGSFRALSLVGLTLFWIVLGLLFGKLVSNPPRPAS